jgi:hypothetical protein
MAFVIASAARQSMLAIPWYLWIAASLALLSMNIPPSLRGQRPWQSMVEHGGTRGLPRRWCSSQ